MKTQIIRIQTPHSDKWNNIGVCLKTVYLDFYWKCTKLYMYIEIFWKSDKKRKKKKVLKNCA